MAPIAGIVLTCLLTMSCAGRRENAASSLAASVEFRNRMRKLWEDHVSYTRNFIISTLGGLEDAPVMADRLFRNHKEIGNAIKPMYGDDAGNQLTTLLKEHITLAAEIMTAARDGNSAAVDAGRKKWRANADAIAALLSGVNSNWSNVDLTDAL